MRPLLLRGDKPWRINAIIAALLIFYIWFRFLIATEPEELKTLSMQAEVVSNSNTVDSQSQSSSFRVVKVRLPDGTHAYITPKWNTPGQGEKVKVLVRVMDDGSRRVSFPEF